MESVVAYTDHSAIENFREYLRIKTVQPKPDYEQAVTFLQKMADQLQLPYRTYRLKPDKPVFVMTWEGKNPKLPSILLNSHVDVVPVFAENWKYDPFSASMDEKGDIYGRGSQDMKCVGMQYIEAVRKLKCSGVHCDRTVHLCFVPEEEVGGVDGMKVFIRSEEFRSLNCGFALDEGLANPSEEFMVYYSERLPWWLEVTFSGNPGHGSVFIQNNAAEKMRRFLNAILQMRDEEEARLKADSSLSLGEVTSVNLTKIEGGVQVNVVPAEFKATFDVRLPPTVDQSQFDSTIQRWCQEAGCDVTYQFLFKQTFSGMTSTAADDPWWSAVDKTFRTMGLKMKLTIMPATTDSRFLREAGCPTIGFSPMNNTPVLLHDHNEFLNAGVFLKGIEIYTHLIENLANVPAPTK